MIGLPAISSGIVTGLSGWTGAMIGLWVAFFFLAINAVVVLKFIRTAVERITGISFGAFTGTYYDDSGRRTPRRLDEGAYLQTESDRWRAHALEVNRRSGKRGRRRRRD